MVNDTSLLSRSDGKADSRTNVAHYAVQRRRAGCGCGREACAPSRCRWQGCAQERKIKENPEGSRLSQPPASSTVGLFFFRSAARQALPFPCPPPRHPPSCLVSIANLAHLLTTTTQASTSSSRIASGLVPCPNAARHRRVARARRPLPA